MRRSFFNCSRAVRRRESRCWPISPTPRGTFYGCIDPSAPLRVTIVVPDDNERVQSVMLRKAEHSSRGGVGRTVQTQRQLRR
ncbi:hypothetical protein ACIF85_36025 [Streptomyces sp. NPDC086033]|uniref:hypothetical protein n=1 Tax=Streptomyces sp. NPDC086033 TaxID=3365747 RepID=UPI0037CEBF76